MSRKGIIILFFAVIPCIEVCAQKIALSNNLLMDGMASANIGMELKVGERITVNVPASINLWSKNDDRNFRHIAVQPEIRRWKCEPFTGHFWGIHAHYAFYNIGGIGPFTALKQNRYEGWLAGIGVSYGYNWILSDRWSIEATVGAGYAYMSHEVYPCGECQPSSGHRKKHYLGPTKAGITLVFLIK